MVGAALISCITNNNKMESTKLHKLNFGADTALNFNMSIQFIAVTLSNIVPEI